MWLFVLVRNNILNRNVLQLFQIFLPFLQVAACSDVALILAENDLRVTSGKQAVIYIGYDNMYSSIRAPGSNHKYG